MRVTNTKQQKIQTHFKTTQATDFLQDQGSKFKQTSSQQAFQRVLFELYGFDSPLPGKLNLAALDSFDDDTDDFPDDETTQPYVPLMRTTL